MELADLPGGDWLVEFGAKFVAVWTGLGVFSWATTLVVMILASALHPGSSQAQAATGNAVVAGFEDSLPTWIQFILHPFVFVLWVVLAVVLVLAWMYLEESGSLAT